MKSTRGACSGNSRIVRSAGWLLTGVLIFTGDARIARAEEEPRGVLTAALPDPGSTRALELKRIERKGRHLAWVGIGLTLSGVGLAAVGVGLYAIPVNEDRMGWGRVIGGGTFSALGGLFFLSGVPTWITGALRYRLARAGASRRLAKRWALAGMIVFFSGLAVSATGGALLTLGSVGGMASGFTLLPFGFAVAMFVGVPMWVEPSRSTWRKSPNTVTGRGPRAPLDFHHERSSGRVIARWFPPAFLLGSRTIRF
jgi:hypothetical protein